MAEWGLEYRVRLSSVRCFALLLYIFWLGVTMGNISRSAFPPIIAKGGNIDVFV